MRLVGLQKWPVYSELERVPTNANLEMSVHYNERQMRKTLREQIDANRRASFFLALLIFLMLVALGTSLVGAFYPKYWPFGLAGSLALAVLCVVIANSMGPSMVLAVAHARPATHAEDQMLDNVVEEMAIAGGVPKPKIYVIDSDMPNAFATGLNPEHGIIAVTTGLVRRLTRDELQGVIAHEMGHIRNYDIKFMTTIAVMVGMIPLLADLFRQMSWFRSWGRDRDNDSLGGLGAVFFAVGLVLAILAPIASFLLQMAVSRKREFMADATAAELTRYPEGLARALQKLSTSGENMPWASRATAHMYIVNPLQLQEEGTSMFSTHPATAERIRALVGLMDTSAREKFLEAEKAPIAPPVHQVVDRRNLPF